MISSSASAEGIRPLRLKAGEKFQVPKDGIYLTNEEMAKFLAQVYASYERIALAGRRATEECENKCERDKREARVKLRTCEIVRKANIDALGKKLALAKRQRDDAAGSARRTPLWVTIAAVAGAGVSVGLCSLAARR